MRDGCLSGGASARPRPAPCRLAAGPAVQSTALWPARKGGIAPCRYHLRSSPVCLEAAPVGSAGGAAPRKPWVLPPPSSGSGGTFRDPTESSIDFGTL